MALVVLVPLAAFTISSRRSASGRAVLGLGPPESGARWTLAALVAVPLLLGLAAAGPGFRTHVGRRIRTDAQAIFILDTSRSMAAAASFTAPTRFDEAQAAAIRLRDDAIPDVPSGVASITTELGAPSLSDPRHRRVRHNRRAARSGSRVATTAVSGLRRYRNVGRAALRAPEPGVLRSDPRSTAWRSCSATEKAARSKPRRSGRLSRSHPGTRRRVSSAVFRRGYLEPSVSLFIVRVGGSSDRIYDSNGKIESAYRPDPTAASTVASLASAAHGQVFATADLSKAGSALRQALGPGSGHLEGMRTKTFNLAPFVAFAALVPLGFVVLRRNITHLLASDLLERGSRDRSCEPLAGEADASVARTESRGNATSLVGAALRSTRPSSVSRLRPAVARRSSAVPACRRA